jgi:F-type H+-transporting ATPase subunit alpha
VSRVGGKAQLPAYRAVAGDLRLSYAQYEELETFARFGTRLDDETRRSLDRGRRIREILKQDEHDPLSVPEQIAVLLAATRGLLDRLIVEQVSEAESAIRRIVGDELSALSERIARGERVSEADLESVLTAARRGLGHLVEY